MDGANQALTHPLVVALKSSGLRSSDASAYVHLSRWMGQVAFARGEPATEKSDRFKAARAAFLSAAQKGQAPHDMAQEVTEALAGKPKLMNTEEKKALAKSWSQQPDFGVGQIFRLSMGREELIQILSGSWVNEAPQGDWGRLDWVAQDLGRASPLATAPREALDEGALRMEPEKIEAALEQKAQALMERFGVGDIRISGMPSQERASEILSALELGFEHLAQAAGMPEKMVGLGGDWSVHVNSEMDRASGYCCIQSKSINLSCDNGWKTLAHEWFHGLDMQTAQSAKVDEWAWSEKWKASLGGGEVESEAFWRQKTQDFYLGDVSMAAAKAAMGQASAALMSGLRSAVASDPLEDVAREETRRSIDRIVEGVYERFYKNRIEPQRREKALVDFQAMCQDMLEGSGGLAQVAAWRKENLGEKAGLCAHYDAFVVAEKIARQARIGEALRSPESAMLRFASVADEQLNAATGNKQWEGYSGSDMEMSARGFEGNCFGSVPEKARSCLTDGGDNSLYWPVGAERGAHAQKYRAFIAAGAVVLSAAGRLAPEELARAAMPREEEMLGKLARKREAKAEPAPSSGARPKH